MGGVRDGCGQLVIWLIWQNNIWQYGNMTKLTVSQEWIDEVNWFSACWYKFRKAKWWLPLVHEMLKSAVLKNEDMH